MTNVAIYYRIINFEKRYEIFERYDNIYTLENHVSNVEESLFELIYLGYIDFIKYFKYTYRDLGINLGLDKDILKKAVSDNLISETEPILKYIDYMNSYNQTTDIIKKKFMKYCIVKEFRSLMYFFADYFKSEKTEEIKKECAPINETILAHPIELDTSIPEYKPEEIGIPESSYRLIIDYFKSNQDIKSVWLYGSRAEKICCNGSDIDLIIDSPLESFDNVIKGLLAIPMPYITDPKNLYAEYDKFFFQGASIYGNKRIYVR